MRVLIVEPDQIPYLKEIGNQLDDLQEVVGGDIQVTYPFEDRVGVICNEEGKLLGLPLNRALYNENEIYDIIARTFIVCGLCSDNFKSLSNTLAQKFYEQFKYPEYFYQALDKSIKATKREYMYAPEELNMEIHFPIEKDILSYLDFTSLHKNSITVCDEGLESQRHDQEIDKIIEGLSRLDVFNKTLAVEAMDYDVAHMKSKHKHYMLKGVAELEELMTSFDLKNGCDIGISKSGGLAFAIYGQNYTYHGYNDTNKKLLIVHPVKHRANISFEISEEKYDKLEKINCTNELLGLNEGIKKSLDREKKSIKEYDRER